MGLSISKKIGETFAVSGPATITIVSIRCDNVRVTIEADPSVAIRRDAIPGHYPMDRFNPDRENKVTPQPQ